MAVAIFRRSSIIGVVLVLLISMQSANAATVVHDPVSFIVSLLNQMENRLQSAQQAAANNQLAVQIKKQLKMIQQLKETYEQAEKTANSLSGKTRYGDYLSGPFKMLDPDHSPKDLDDVLWNMRNVGRGQTRQDTYSKSAEGYSKLNPFVDLSDYQPPERESYRKNDMQNQQANSLSLIASSRLAYRAASQHYGNVRQMQKEIGRTDTIKESMDLNSRILTELVVLQSQQLRLMSMQTQTQGQERQQNYNEKARALQKTKREAPAQWKKAER